MTKETLSSTSTSGTTPIKKLTKEQLAAKRNAQTNKLSDKASPKIIQLASAPST